MKIKCGWVLECRDKHIIMSKTGHNGQLFVNEDESNYVRNIGDAHIYQTRQEARDAKIGGNSERVKSRVNTKLKHTLYYLRSNL